MILSTPDPAVDRFFGDALLQLQHEAYRTQAELIGSNRLAALEADSASLPAWRGRYLVAWEGTQLVGALAWRLGDVVEIDRVMVAPKARRSGVATTLIRAILDDVGHRTVVSFTGRDNAPGLALYRRFDFTRTTDEQAPSGIWFTHLRRD